MAMKGNTGGKNIDEMMAYLKEMEVNYIILNDLFKIKI